MGKYDALFDEPAAPAAAKPARTGKYAALFDEEPVANAGNTVPEVGTRKPTPSLGEAILPRTLGAPKGEESTFRRLGDAALAAIPGAAAFSKPGLDMLSLGGRTIAGAVESAPQPVRTALSAVPQLGALAMIPKGPEDEGIKDRMADTQGKSFLGGMARDPALLPGALLGGSLVSGLGRAGLGAARTLGVATGAGAAEGAGSAAIHQADNLAQGRGIDLKQAAIETGVGAAIPGVAAAAGAAVKGGVWTANKMLGKAAEELSGVSEEALRTFGLGFGKGAKDLKAAAGTQHEIGQKLVKMLDDLDNFLPEKQVVDQALQQMPAVNVGNTIQRLQGAKTGGALASSRATNAKIDELISDLGGAADETGNIPAAKFREIRKEIDGLVGDAFGKESGKYVSALKEARHQMADDLATTADASGMPEYAEAMRGMAQKLRKADDLKSFLGKSAQTREQRAESFVSTLFGKNKEERRKAVQAMGEIFGEDFLAESKLAALAAELGDEGKAGLLPRQFTGRAALGPALGMAAGNFVNPASAIPGFALASPRIAAGTLEITDWAGRLGLDAARLGGRTALSAPGRLALRRAATDDKDAR